MRIVSTTVPATPLNNAYHGGSFSCKIHKEVSKMSSSFLYAKKPEVSGTLILPLPNLEAINVMKENRGCDFQLGVLGGADLQSVMRVYGEFAPYKKVESVQELLETKST